MEEKNQDITHQSLLSAINTVGGEVKGVNRRLDTLNNKVANNVDKITELEKQDISTGDALEHMQGFVDGVKEIKTTILKYAIIIILAMGGVIAILIKAM